MRQCRWPECDRDATGSDGVCDRHAVDYWRVWRERQSDVWVEVKCPRCGAHFEAPVKQCDLPIWPVKWCGRC